MQLAFTILIMALNLISSVNQSPNATPELRLQASQIASYAISYAQSILEEATSTPVISARVDTPLQIPKAEPVLQIGSTLQSPSVVVTVSDPVVPVNQLTFTTQPVAGHVVKLMGTDYIYEGTRDWSQGGWKTNKDVQNQKETCMLNNVELQPSAALEKGQTYTCTLTVVTKYSPDWSTLSSEDKLTSEPYSFTVPLN